MMPLLYLAFLIYVSKSIPVDLMKEKVMQHTTNSIKEKVRLNGTSMKIEQSIPVDFYATLKANPKQFISQVASLDPAALRNIISLLRNLRGTSETREQDLIDALDGKIAALAAANTAVAGAEDDLTNANKAVQAAKDAIAAGQIVLDSKEQDAVQAQGALDEKKEIHRAKQSETDDAQTDHDDEVPSLNDEQRVLTEVITILEDLHTQQANPIHSDEVISLMRGAKWVTCPNGRDCRLTDSFSDDSKLMFRKGYDDAAFNRGDGADSTELADGDAITIKLGTSLNWQWSLDCAGNPCSYQNHKGTSGGHWGTPNKIHKVNNQQTVGIIRGDLIWFEQMTGWNNWTPDSNIECNTAKCYKASGKPEFKVCDDSGNCGV